MTTYITPSLGVLVTFCAMSDLRFQKIPNLLTLPAALMAFLYHAHHSGLPGLYESLWGWVLGLLLLIVPYRMKAMGAGDVKLLAAVGAVVGPINVIIIFLYSSIIGGLYALLHRIYSEIRFNFTGDFYQTIKHFVLFRKILGGEDKSVNKGSHLCYGIAIAAGTYTYIGEALGFYRIIFA
jgi:prepilin peptidase CpaA